MNARRARVGVVAVVALLVAPGCNGDDDNADPTTTPAATTSPPSTAPPTTGAPTTPPTTRPSLVVTAPTVAVDIEALKAEIAADFLEIEAAGETLERSPTLDGLEERAAEIAVPGSVSYAGLIQFIEELVANGQRMAPGQPDYSDVTVESVEIVGDPGDGTAVVTFCEVTNRVRLEADGTPVPGSGDLFAARLAQPVQRTPGGWRWSDEATGIAIERGATTCPAS